MSSYTRKFLMFQLKIGERNWPQLEVRLIVSTVAYLNESLMGFNGKSRRCLSWMKNPRIIKRMNYVLHVFHDSSPRGGRLGSH